ERCDRERNDDLDRRSDALLSLESSLTPQALRALAQDIEADAAARDLGDAARRRDPAAHEGIEDGARLVRSARRQPPELRETRRRSYHVDARAVVDASKDELRPTSRDVDGDAAARRLARPDPHGLALDAVRHSVADGL